jgi:hypothetical protein
MTSSVYKTSAPEGNVSPGRSRAALALKGRPERHGKTGNSSRGSGNEINVGGTRQSAQRNGRAIEPKPDALWHTPNRDDRRFNWYFTALKASPHCS